MNPIRHAYWRFLFRSGLAYYPTIRRLIWTYLFVVAVWSFVFWRWS